MGLWVNTTIHNQDVFVRRSFVFQTSKLLEITKYGRVETTYENSCYFDLLHIFTVWLNVSIISGRMWGVTVRFTTAYYAC